MVVPRSEGDRCERCGFIPLHPRQLDVHHLDGNKANNDLSNLQTLCANCHRLEGLDLDLSD
jgi:5-methylcytosine-specific restriction endonuclease McrA